MNKFFIAIIMVVGMAMMATQTFAGEIDILVQKLVEKNVLTPLEAQIILDETKAEVAKQNAQGKNKSLPKWIQTTKLKGDFRLRYQYERKESDIEGRERGRIRYRLGIISNPLPKIEVGAGLASGGSDARSTNQTFDDVFSTSDIRLDYAYAQYQVNNDLTVIGGKFKRKAYLWAPSDLLWDGDINPEGGSLHYSKMLTNETDLFVNTGVWYLDHKDQVDATDPFMSYVQSGLKYVDEKVDAKLAGVFYNFNGIKGTTQYESSNTGNGSGEYKYDYDSGAVSVEVGVRNLFGGLPYMIDDRIALFADYVYNPDPDDENVGWLVGMKLGHKKVKKPKTWQAKYMYASLGKDAWFEALPDSDRYGGDTNVKSHEVSFNYALMKNLTVGIDYYYSDILEGTKDAEQVVQADLKVKF
jgi:hypothetical protein